MQDDVHRKLTANNRFVRLLPINPVPPVTRVFFICVYQIIYFFIFLLIKTLAHHLLLKKENPTNLWGSLVCGASSSDDFCACRSLAPFLHNSTIGFLTQPPSVYSATSSVMSGTRIGLSLRVSQVLLEFYSYGE